MNQRTPFLRLLLVAALLPLLATAAPVAAQTVNTIRLAVVDPASGQELAVIAPGSEISMAPGQSMTLRLFEPMGTRKRDRQPIPTEFGFGPAGTPTALTIVSSAPERGEVTVRLADSARPGQKEHVGFKIEPRVKLGNPSLQLGRVVVRVVGTAVAPAQQYYVPGYQSYNSQIDALVDAFYRGILLRAPDPSGGANYRNAIASGGYQSVRQVAHDIAASDESRRVAASPEQRLTALYQNLLGMSPNDVDPRQWDSDVAHIARGDIAGVVDQMVQSRTFQYRYGFYYGR